MMALWMILSPFWSNIAKTLLRFMVQGILVELDWTKKMLFPWIVRYMCTLNTNVHIINTLKEYKIMIMNKLVFQTNTPVWIPGESKLRPLHWNHNAAGTSISFKNTPFQIGYKRDLDCQYGNHYYKNKQESSKGSTKDAKDKKLPRLRTQGTRKQGCRACIHIREYVLFSEYSIEDDITKNMSKWKLRQLKEEKKSKFLEIILKKV